VLANGPGYNLPALFTTLVTAQIWGGLALGFSAEITHPIYCGISSINPITIKDEKGVAYSTNGLFFKTNVHGQVVHLLFYSHEPKFQSHGNRRGNFVMKIRM
jgi:hypothetical protein